MRLAPASDLVVGIAGVVLFEAAGGRAIPGSLLHVCSRPEHGGRQQALPSGTSHRKLKAAKACESDQGYTLRCTGEGAGRRRRKQTSASVSSTASGSASVGGSIKGGSQGFSEQSRDSATQRDQNWCTHLLGDGLPERLPQPPAGVSHPGVEGGAGVARVPERVVHNPMPGGVQPRGHGVVAGEGHGGERRQHAVRGPRGLLPQPAQEPPKEWGHCDACIWDASSCRMALCTNVCTEIQRCAPRKCIPSLLCTTSLSCTERPVPAHLGCGSVSFLPSEPVLCAPEDVGVLLELEEVVDAEAIGGDEDHKGFLETRLRPCTAPRP